MTGCLLARRSGTLPRPLCVIGAVALVYPLGVAIHLVTGYDGGGLWVVGVASLVLGLPVWFLANGVWALVTRTGLAVSTRA